MTSTTVFRWSRGYRRVPLVDSAAVNGYHLTLNSTEQSSCDEVKAPASRSCSLMVENCHLRPRAGLTLLDGPMPGGQMRDGQMLDSPMAEPARPASRRAKATQVIHTARLSLDPLVVSDADEMAEALGDPELHRYIGGRPASPDELRDRYARMVVGIAPDGSQEWHNWTMRRLADGRAVGTVQATVTDHGASAELAWVMGTAWQGQGLCSEAAKAVVDWLTGLGVRTMSANIHPGHGASEAVARRIGLALTSEWIDGERVWRRALAETPAHEDARPDRSTVVVTSRTGEIR